MEARRARSRHIVNSAKAACATSAVIGIHGSICDPLQQGALSVGTLVESTQFEDIILRGFGGQRFVTATALVQVCEVSSGITTVQDAAEEPSVDNKGVRVYGRIARDDEVFRIVGHSLLGDQVIQWDDP